MSQDGDTICNPPSNVEILLSNQSININADSKIDNSQLGSSFVDNIFNKESLQSIKISTSISININKLDTKKEENSKKFFVKLLGYDPKFFFIKDFEKKLGEIIEEYLEEIKLNKNDRIKKTFTYKEKLINLNDTIKNIEHLGWITSEGEN